MNRFKIYGIALCAILCGSVGLLVMHHMRTKAYCLLVIKNGTFYGTDLETYLKNRKVSYLVADKNSDINKVMRHTYKGIILSGGPLLYSDKHVNIIESVNINFAAILNLDVPVLGICFGHQTLVELFGGKMGNMKKLSKGMQTVKFVHNTVLFDGLPNVLEMHQNHYDCGTQIPYNFELVATSNICALEGIKHATKPIFGVQFHPESSGKHGYQLLDNFLRLCGCTFSTTT